MGGFKDFGLKKPEKHVEHVVEVLEKRNVTDEDEKVKALVKTFKKGDAKLLY
ncbi:hypothetical protein HDU67_005944, partial [Dinochytrium kinnereticum]